jgi:hypothetical protein
MATPLVNGINYSWVNITVVLFGVPLIGITKINYKAKQAKENNYGQGPYPVSRGYGRYEYEGSIEIYTDEWKRIISASPGRDPLQIAPFDIQIVYAGTRVTPDRDVLRMVEFLENPLDFSEGDTKSLITIPLIIADITR